MAQKNPTNWEYDAEYIQPCNCDWGCPCNVGAKPTHGFCEGGGTIALYLDAKSNTQQRQAVESMVTGKAPGLPWTIVSATMDHWLQTKTVPFEWNFNGAHSSFKAGSFAHLDTEPIRNPVSGAEGTATILLPDGFLFQEALIASSRSFSVFDN